ncbi:MAG: glycosyltransferase family 4 protein [Patescibacteria group bacterium]
MKNKKLKIAIVSKLWEPSSPYSTGGTGVIVGNLVNGLVKRGHEVTLFATGNSKTLAQKTISVQHKSFLNDYSEIKEYQNIYNCYKIAHKFDIINTHVEHKACFFAPLTKTPTIINIEYGEFLDDELNLIKENKNLIYVTISKSMKLVLPFIKFKKIIHCGIDLNLFPFNNEPKDYLLFLARISPQKGPHMAIRLAKETNHKLIMAGKKSLVDKNYLRDKVFKFVDNKQIFYLGEVQFRKKIDLFKNALAFLHPISFHEAFGITLIEAGACGTPIIAFNNGSPKEIINNGVNGWVVENFNQMKQKIQNLNRLSRLKCRQIVEERFSVEKMVASYEKLFYEITNKK